MQPVYFLGKMGYHSSCLWRLMPLFTWTVFMVGANCHIKPVGAETSSALDCQSAPAPSSQVSSPQPTQGRDLVLAGCAHTRCRNRTSAALSVLYSNQGSTYFTPKQSRHELIYIHHRCRDYYLA